ncbi:hypothetical protein M514_27988, partial [Trichuris suis]
MDEGGVRLRIDNVWKKRPERANNRSLLVWDSFRSHVTQRIKSYINECKIETAVIPGGLTSILQPLNVCVNKPFKDHMRKEWMEWMSNGQKTYTPRGCMRALPLEVLCEFVIKAWKKIKVDTVMKSFRKCFIYKDSEGREDVDLSDTDESC